jgi:hypothetical protein
MINPLDDPELAGAAGRAARKVLESGWARIEQQLPGHREKLAALQNMQQMQEESRLQVLQRATEERYRFDAQQEANQPGPSSRSGYVGVSKTASAAAAASSSSRSGSSTAAAGSGSPSHGSSSRQLSEAGQTQAPGPVGGAKQWQEVFTSLAHIDKLLQQTQSGEMDRTLVDLCAALEIRSLRELNFLVQFSTGVAASRVGYPTEPMLGMLAGFWEMAGWDESFVAKLAGQVHHLVACLGHKSAAPVCGHDVVQHAETVLQMREQRQLHRVVRADAAAAVAAARVSSFDPSCDPVLRLRGGGPGSSTASSEAGECASDGEGFEAAAAASAQELEHCSPAAAAAAAASTSHQDSSSSSGSAQATALPSSVLQAYASALRIWKRLVLRTGKLDLSKLQQEAGLAGPAAEPAAQHVVEKFSPASQPAHFNSMPMQAAMQWVLLLLHMPHTEEFVQVTER